MKSAEYLNVIKNASRMGEKAGVDLTDTHKAFLLQLIDLVEKTSYNEGFSTALSYDTLAEKLDTPRHTVINSMEALRNAGILFREADSGKRKGRGLNPMITTINEEVFQKNV